MKKILLMDDSPLFLEVTRAALESAGFEVVCATTLGELERVQEGRAPDLVLMDVQMPEAFGDDVALVLRSARGLTAPIHLLSSLDESELAERVRWAEIDGYISKTHGIEAVVERVQEIFARAEAGE